MTSTSQHRSRIAEAFKAYSAELGLIGTFFILTLTLANLVHRLFGVPLLPFFEQTFATFHTWAHVILDLLVFSWVTWIAEWLWYGVTWVASCLFPIVPWKPDLSIPPLMSDVSLVSAAFTRVLGSTDLILPRGERAAAETAMTPDQWKEIDELEGKFWGPIHRFLERLNRRIWALVEGISSLAPTGRLRGAARSICIALAGAVLLWGFLRLAGYLINIAMARRSAAPIMAIRRRFFTYFVLNFLGAIVAVAAFFVLNGWLADFLAP